VNNLQISPKKLNIIIKLVLFLVCLLPVGYTKFAFSEVDPAEAIKNKEIGFETALGTKLDTQIPFTDEDGNQTSLSSLLKPAQPTLFVPMYFSCPRLCGLLMNGFIELIRKLDLKQGSEYNVVTLSFDPTEDSKLAKDKQQTVLKEIDRSDITPKSWRFLTGKEENIKKLLDQAGYKYKFAEGEYLHSSGFFILTSEGEISQYFTGIDFSAWDVRLAMVEASKGGIGSAVDHILLYCYDFDPSKGKYTLTAFNVLRFGTLFAVILFFIVAVKLSRRVVKNN
jgi:protein SCO1/2